MRVELLQERLSLPIKETALAAAKQILNDAVDTSTGGFTLVGAAGALVGGEVDKEISLEDARTLRAQVFKLYHKNPHVRSIIRTLVKFVFGKGVTVSFSSPDDLDLEDEAKAYWTKWKKVNKWNLKQKEMGTRTFRDGEAFLYSRRVKGLKVPRLQFLEPDQIQSPNPDISFGIETDKDDVEDIKSYRWMKDTITSKELVIPASQIVHTKIFGDSNQKRGRTILEPVLKHITMYEQWLSDRMVLNKVRAAVALIRHVEGSAAQLRAIRAQSKDTSSPLKDRRAKVMRAGTIITAKPGVKYEMLSPNLQAADVQHDGRSILLAISTGVGFPEMFLTADFSNANFASSLTAQNPLVREFEDYQNTFGEYMIELVTEVFDLGIEMKALSEGILDNVDVTVTWPPLIHRDLKALVDALNILFANGILSRSTFAAETGHDFEKEQELIKTDAESAEEEELPSEEEEEED